MTGLRVCNGFLYSSGEKRPLTPYPFSGTKNPTMFEVRAVGRIHLAERAFCNLGDVLSAGACSFVVFHQCPLWRGRENCVETLLNLTYIISVL